MALTGGINSQLGFGVETAWGTAVTVNKFVEFNEESIELQQEYIDSEGLRPGRRVLKSNQFVANTKGVSGDITLELWNKGFAQILKGMLGSGAVTTPVGATNARLHTFLLGDSMGKSFTVQVGRPDIGGNVRAFTWSGMKVTEWEVSTEVDGLILLNLSFDGKSESTATPLASALYPSNPTLFSFKKAVVKVDGAEFEAKSFSISGTQGLDTERYYLGGNGAKKEQVGTEMQTVEGSIATVFTDLAVYNKFVSGAPASISIKCEGPEIESGQPYQFNINIPCVRYDGAPANVSGTGILEQEVSFTVLDNGTDQPLTIEYVTDSDELV